MSAARAVLFDLDGTLLDSAPDLYEALRLQCAEEGVPAPDYPLVRAVVSRGARAVLRCGYRQLDEAALLDRLPRFLALYEQCMGSGTRPFDGIEALLARCEAARRPWGIVTNKAGSLTEGLLARIGWRGRAAAVVAGDTLSVKKPDPAPVRLACEQAGVEPTQTLFVGDDVRDIQAGRAAGLITVAVRWGYLDGGDPQQWGADHVIDHPAELAVLLDLPVPA